VDVRQECTADAQPFPPERAFGGHLSPWLRAALRLGGDDLMICRCEGTTLRELNDAMALVGDRVPDEL
jgi:hypothetical protein